MKKAFKRISILLIAFIYVGAFSVDTYALVDTEFYSSNTIIFYDPTDLPCTEGLLVLSGNDNREKIFNFLIAKGLNSDQAIGVVANIEKESQFSPTRQEGGQEFGSGGYGLAQWTGTRRDQLVEYLHTNHDATMDAYYNEAWGGPVTKSDGYLPTNSEIEEKTLMPLADNDILLLAELNFLYDESTEVNIITSKTAENTSATAGENEWEALKKATSIEDATKIWLYNFERPANIESEAVSRSERAEEMLEEIESAGLVSASTTTCLDDSSGDTAAIQARVQQYAWPDFTAGRTERKPEYAEAVSAAVANGGFVGGANGVDCGGFVTRVMIDSGFEPDYNSKKGNTERQKEWLDENWEVLGAGGSIDTATLQPGDVAIQPGHTFMFAGTDLEGFGTKTDNWKGVASASLNNRAPMAGLEDMTDPDVTWYRKPGGHVHE